MMADALKLGLWEQVRWLLEPRYWPGSLLQSQQALAELHQASDVATKEGKPVQLTPICRNSHDARRILRIEIDRNHEAELWAYLVKNGLHYDHEKPGPLQFDGVDCYIVPRLDAPGFRIINPMRK